jgi:hypothetical protein
LLSEETFVSRIEHLLARRVVDPMALIGDLSFRTRRGWRSWRARIRLRIAARTAARAEPELLLALDWSGTERELLIGRGYGCDVVLTVPSVSRQHARVIFRDGNWILRDLGSTNGTTVNGAQVGRCVLRPGDHLTLGAQRLRVD